ncbi:MAG: sigma-70 family RNA polymerase sigma factor [Planctomycetota bacterium]
MTDAATTRLSLLIRLHDSGDTDAWEQFVEIYSPLVFHFARNCDLQESDAADLVQEVMSEVSKCISRFEYNPEIGKFRSWLYKIAKRKVWRLGEKRRKQPQGAGDSATLRFLENQPDSQDDFQQLWDSEYERHLLDWAARKIRSKFNESTWKAFWMTSVEDMTPQSVAKALNISVGSVYVARSRVAKRLAEKIREIDDSL